MLLANDWKDYELLDTGNGEKLERWGSYILRRPDPQIIWPACHTENWDKADGRYIRSARGGGQWEFSRKLPDRWKISYNDLSFYIEPTGFKHTGLFPEQAVNWSWMINKIKSANRPINVLNLFAYTGGATVACAYAGAKVCHVDAAKGMVTWAKENLELSELKDRPVRFIVDDVVKFIEREERRGSHYDAIIMDPPSYGRGPAGEVWHIENELYNLVTQCAAIMTQQPLFFIINSYTTGFSPTVLENILKLSVAKKYSGSVSHGEVGLPVTTSQLILPCGIYARWETL
jgi:23S rRNA (cytosine1962-C5)-methyltransferase